MANAFDFTGGYLGMKRLKEERQQAQDLKAYREAAIDLQRQDIQQRGEIQRADLAQRAPYLAAMTRNVNANAGSTELNTDTTRRTLSIVNPILERITRRLNNGTGVSASPIDYTSIGGGFNLGFKPDYSLNGGKRQSLDANNVTLVDPQEGEVPQFADGTVGALRVAPGSAANGATVGDAGATPVAAANPAGDASGGGFSAITELANADPNKANTVVRNIFGASNKEFQQMMGAFALVDFAKGKITSDQMLTQVENLRKMQAEGIGRATQAALAGNLEKAKKLYAEYGDDDGAEIEGMRKIEIANPVTGAAKGTKDKYDAIEVTYKGGGKMIYDPRRLLAETVSLKELMDHNERTATQIRTNDANIYQTDTAAQSNRLRSEELAFQRQLQQQGAAQTRLANEFKNYEDNEIELLLKGSRRVDLMNKPELMEAEKARISRQSQAGRTLAAINIELGNLNIDSGRALQYGQFMEISADENDPRRAFWQNPANFRVGPNGKPLVANAGGRQFYQTVDGVFLPAPTVRQAPQPQAAPPAPGAAPR